MPKHSVLYLEIYNQEDEDGRPVELCETHSLFLQHIQQFRCPPNAVEKVSPACTAVTPLAIEHLSFGQPLVDAAERFAQMSHEPLASHVHGYSEGELIFWFHDAFIGGDMLVSPKFTEDQIRNFCTEMSPKFERLTAKDWDL